jgi:hypothetical protein
MVRVGICGSGACCAVSVCFDERTMEGARLNFNSEPDSGNRSSCPEAHMKPQENVVECTVTDSSKHISERLLGTGDCRGRCARVVQAWLRIRPAAMVC